MTEVWVSLEIEVWLMMLSVTMFLAEISPVWILAAAISLNWARRETVLPRVSVKL